MGIMGVAPSADQVERFAAREWDVVSRGGLALPPEAAGAVPMDSSIAEAGLRTIPPRENGGNVDIKQLTSGTRVFLPVSVEGALFSAGDAHFAQGDGEVCGTAIEISATLRARFELIKGRAKDRNIKGIQFEQIESHPPVPGGRVFVTTGIPVDEDGVCHPEDLTMAARNALLSMIDHIVAEYGFTAQQAYSLCSVAVDLKASQIVDVPNFIVSAFLPLYIFDST